MVFVSVYIPVILKGALDSNTGNYISIGGNLQNWGGPRYTKGIQAVRGFTIYDFLFVSFLLSNLGREWSFIKCIGRDTSCGWDGN